MGKTVARILAVVAIVIASAVALIWFTREPPAASNITPSVAISGDPYGELLDVIRSGSNNPELAANLQNDLAATFAADPRFVRLENQSPGTIREIVTALAPLMEQRSKRLFAEHRPALIAILKSGLGEGEAAEARRFFASPTGGKVLDMVAANATMRETYGSMTSGKAESDAEVAVHMERDRETMKQRVQAQLTPEDKAQIEGELSSQPWIRSFSAIMPQYKAALARLENAPLSATEEKAMAKVVERVLRKRGFQS